ncbi:hypothetical protein FisN_16Lh315 [Fistulifera solaris]|uniref:PA14 domain-containing protein n=1 Tax=Fistulifera solaris TaxID=1519565 RepID=A0A1Z5KNY1_FISSO|nr:hypothetical protein FisN_16Lh315 [Fistulifera solaris]|eukprot:GAX27989.1 hypothetical protein FisN_16Lh315 [Fistulifera solaris]
MLQGRFSRVLVLCLLVASCSAQKSFLRPSLPDDARGETVIASPNATADSDALMATTTLQPLGGTTTTNITQQSGLSLPKPISISTSGPTATGVATNSTTSTGSISNSTGATPEPVATATTTTTSNATAANSTPGVPPVTTVTTTETGAAVPPRPTPLTPTTPTVGMTPTISMAPSTSVPTLTMMPSIIETLEESDTSTLTTITMFPSEFSGSLTPVDPANRRQPFLHRKVGIEDVTNSSLVSLVPADGDVPAYFGNLVLNSWFEFEWDIPVAGFYDVHAGIASPEGAGSFDLVDMNTTHLYEIFVGFTPTEAWDTFANFSRQIEVLTPTLTTMRVEIVSEGFNIQYLYLTPSVLRDAIEERDGVSGLILN